MEHTTDKKVMKAEKQEQDKVKILLTGLAAGECKGVKGATAYKIAEYAQQKGLT